MQTDMQTHAYTYSPCKLFFYRWYKDGKPVRQGEGLRVAANGRQLIVSRAQVSDTARFQCVATNEAGDHERDFNVVVHGINIEVLCHMICMKIHCFLTTNVYI